MLFSSVNTVGKLLAENEARQQPLSSQSLSTSTSISPSNNSSLVIAEGPISIAKLRISSDATSRHVFPAEYPEVNDNGQKIVINECADLSADETFLMYSAHSGFSNQYGEVTEALLLAHLLNRTLVLPKVQAHYFLTRGRVTDVSGKGIATEENINRWYVRVVITYFHDNDCIRNYATSVYVA